MSGAARSIFLRTGSHRSRQRLQRELERELEWFWTLEHGGVFTCVTPEEYARVKGISGVTRPRQQTGYGRCISMA